MPQFQYNAMESTGQPVQGTIEANQIQEAIAKLKGMGYFITSISPAKGSGISLKKETGRQTTAAGPSGVKKSAKGKGMSISLSLGPQKIKTKELMIITRQLATLIGSGLPLLRALRVLREQRKGAPNAILGRVAEDIESGALFSEALSKHPRSFPNIYVAMVRAGEAGGALEAVLNRLAEFMEKEAKLRGKIKAALAYPMVIVIVASGILTFLMLRIVPTFIQIFEDMEAGELPAPTVLLMKISKLFTHRFYLIIIFVVAMAILFNVLNRIKFTKYYIDMAKLRMPVFGPVVSKTVVARFARTFATLITSGVPILQALQIVRDTTGNDVISNGINEIRNRVREGEGIVGPMLRSKVFPAMVTNMVAVGEETGAMDSMLEKIAEAYESEVDSAVAAMTSMLEPILIVFMGGVVGFIVISLFLPLIRLAMGLSGGGGGG
ncbi:MAG: type II secretion system F family protein [Candidatus Omnitrophica bacterium]|nr:type II secretion system F family protein [Candidatus Omnitrophota bacterium]